MWRIAQKGIKTRRCFNEKLNQIARKLNLRENQEEWRQTRTVASKLRRANKVTRQLKKEAYTLRASEREKPT